MSEKKFRRLKIDPEFKNLIRPLRREEYRQLELNLVREGCREDIVVWNDTIVDGHNRYEICNKLHMWSASRRRAETADPADRGLCGVGRDPVCAL